MTDTLLKTLLHLPARRDVWLPASMGFRVNVPEAPVIKNPDRRRACRFDLGLYKRSYFPWFKDTGTFHGPFLALLQRLILSEGIAKKAVAAPRGIAKTYDTVIAVSWAMCYGHRRYIPWICRKIDYAVDRVEMVQSIFRNNANLREDFPELCLPFVGMTPQQIKAPLKMSAEELVLPNHCASLAYSIESALRGLILADGRRPDFPILDDIVETKKGSDPETKNLQTIIEENLGGIAELGGNMASLMLATIPFVGCISDTYTTPAKKPSWNGVRWKAMLAKPERQDLWTRFKELCANAEFGADEISSELIDVAAVIGMRPKVWGSIESPGHRRALEFYARRKAEMDAGCEMLDPSRLPAHHYYSQMISESESFVAGEYDQEPLVTEHNQTTQLKIEHLMTRRIGPKQGVVPEWGYTLNCTIDVNKPGLHWEVNAFGRGGQWCLIDQGEQSTGLKEQNFKMIDDTQRKNRVLEKAIQDALEAIKQHTLKGYANEVTGELMYPALYGPDVGGTDGNFAWSGIVIAYCNRAENVKRWRPMKGFQWKATMVARAQAQGIANGQWERLEKHNPGGVIHRNADYWKSKVEESSTMEAIDKDGVIRPGARIFHQATPRVYFHHQCNEFYLEAVADDAKSAKELKPGWNPLSGPNDWFDTAAEAICLFDVWKWERRKAAQQGQRKIISSPGSSSGSHDSAMW